MDEAATERHRPSIDRRRTWSKARWIASGLICHMADGSQSRMMVTLPDDRPRRGRCLGFWSSRGERVREVVAAQWARRAPSHGRLDMKKLMMTALGASMLAVACGASYPAPQQKLADAEAAHRSAKELGADRKTEAQLNLKLAEEEIGAARAQIKAGENERAESTLLRAKADAELALALAREHDAKNEAG